MAYTPVTWAVNTGITAAQLQNINDEIVRLATLLQVIISVQAAAPATPATNQVHLW